jgi:hypothetical protein
VPFDLPPSFWTTLYRLAGGEKWPPENDAQAQAFMARVVPEGLLSLMIAEAASMPPVVSRAAHAFQALDRSNRLRASVFEDSVRKVLDILDGEQLIILKGTDYAYRLYPAPHLRPRQDVDVLVPRERVREITWRLKKEGFRQHFPAGAVARVRAYHEAVFVIGNATLEVHHSFIQRTRNRIDYAGVWSRVKPWSGFDRRLFQLDEIDALIYHAINMSTDQFSNPMFRHLDFWLMLHDRQQILPAAVARARTWATTRALYGALRQASRYFPEMKTPAVEEAMSQLIPRRTQAFLDRHVLPDPWRPRKRYGRVGQLWRKLWLIDDSFHRASFALYHGYAVIAGKLLELRDQRPSL